MVDGWALGLGWLMLSGMLAGLVFVLLRERS